MTCTTRDPAAPSQTPSPGSSSERRAASFADGDAMFGLAALLILCVMMAGALALLLL